MAIEGDLRAHLVADAGVAALVGDRIYMQVRPEGSDLPAVVITVVDDLPHYDLQRATAYRVARYQLDGFGAAYGDAKRLQAALGAALSGYRGQMGGTTVLGAFVESRHEDRDEETQTTRASVDVRIHYR